jgi:penicillin-binding protein 1A
MSQALGANAAPNRPAPTAIPDPGGPVEPLDVPDLGDIPLGDGNSRVRIQDGEAIFSTEIDGVPVDVRIGENGVGVDEQQIEEARRRAEERLIEAEERRQEREYEQIRRQLESQRQGGPG